MLFPRVARLWHVPLFLVLLFGCVGARVVFGQSQASKDLGNEPEIKQIQRITEGFRDQQRLPYSDVDKLPPAQGLLDIYIRMKASLLLRKKLHERLLMQVKACNDCKAKHDELVLFDQLEATQRQMEGIFFAGRGLPGVTDFESFDNYLASAFKGKGESLESKYPSPTLPNGQPNPEFLRRAAENSERNARMTRWDDGSKGWAEAGGVIEDYCRVAAPTAIEVCEKQYDRERVSYAHEHAWAECLQQHNILAQPGERVAYDRCMNASDQQTKLCSETLALQKKSGTCAGPAVTERDAKELAMVLNPALRPVRRSVQIEFVSTPPRTTVSVTMQQAIMGNQLSNPKGFSGRLASDLLSEHGAVLLPAGTSVVVMGRPRGNKMSVYAHTAEGGDLPDKTVTLNTELLTVMSNQAMGQQFMLYPAGATLTFTTTRPISVGLEKKKARELEAKAPANPVASAMNVSQRPQLGSGSRLPVMTMDAVDAEGAQAGKLFHAKLEADVTLKGTDHAVLPAGTEVYLRLPGVADGATRVNVVVDHLVYQGRSIPVPTDDLYRDVEAPQAARTAPRRSSRRPQLRWGNIAVPLPPAVSQAGDTKNGSANGTSRGAVFFPAKTEIIFSVSHDVNMTP